MSFNHEDFNLTAEELETIKKFANQNPDKRMGDIMVLGDKGDPQFFFLFYYAALSDPELDVRLSAVKRISKFHTSPHFNKLLANLEKPEINNKLEPYYSMLLFRLGKITKQELNERLSL
jgi:hypothetical protein